jgi:hypothetical protein
MGPRRVLRSILEILAQALHDGGYLDLQEAFIDGDGRPLRRYRRRWKIERLFAWFQKFRRIVVRYERFAENFLGMPHLACRLILLRGL